MLNKIPKIIHQIWVGSKEMPVEWMQTWKDKHSEWEFMLWDNASVAKHDFRHKDKIERCIAKGLPHGAADIIRYEILYEFGGVVAPADSICLLPIDELLDIEEDCFCCYQHEVKRPGLLSPHLGTSANNGLMAKIIDRIPSNIKQPWQQTGNLLLTKIVKELGYPIKVYPSVTFIPTYNDGSKQEGKAHAEHLWGSTLHRYKTIRKT